MSREDAMHRWQAAFEQSTGKSAPKMRRGRSGWFYIRNDGGRESAVSLSTLESMTAALLARVAAATADDKREAFQSYMARWRSSNPLA